MSGLSKAIRKAQQVAIEDSQGGVDPFVYGVWSDDGSVTVQGVVIADVPLITSVHPKDGNTVLCARSRGMPLTVVGVVTPQAAMAVFDESDTSTENFSSSSYEPAPGAPQITFYIPPGAPGNIFMMVDADTDSTADQFEADVEIVDDQLNVVHNASASTGGVGQAGADTQIFIPFTGMRPLLPLNLSPGIYTAQLQIFTNDDDIDISHQWIHYVP